MATDWENTGYNEMLQGFADAVATGGGAAKIQIVDETVSPDVVLLEFDLPQPEFVLDGNNQLLLQIPTGRLTGIAVASSSAGTTFKNHDGYIVARDGTRLALMSPTFEITHAANTTLNISAVGFKVIDSGQKYQHSLIDCEMGTAGTQ